jgi:hypothetical protein
MSNINEIYWQPIETAPTDGTPILVWIAIGEGIEGQTFSYPDVVYACLGQWSDGENFVRPSIWKAIDPP